MLKQKDFTTKTSDAVLNLTEIGDIICNSGNAMTITLPSPNKGMWYSIFNVNIGKVNIFHGSALVEIKKGEQCICFADNSTTWFTYKALSSFTKTDIENVLTGVISSHSHEMGSIFFTNEAFVEDFETEEPILNRSGTWVVTNADKISGSASLRSNKNSTITFTFETLTSIGELSFYYKVGSEANYDKFYARIDGVTVINGVSGIINWTKFSKKISAGLHTLQFQYTKDGSGDKNGDTIYVDLISYSGDDRVYHHSITDHSKIAKMLGEKGSLVKVNQTEDGLEYVKIIGTVLPTASEEYRGQIFTLLGGTGVSDIGYRCIKNATDTYEWVVI